MLHEHGALAQFLDVVEVVGGEDDRGAGPAVEFGDEAAYSLLGKDIKSQGRLVEVGPARSGS
ncbi:hypothetical protein AB0O64_05585 [Streptomyces sp. NPDC088341]|uniref:hypothetical protein n=1 Tax=Streptomyces sp. NPDC088341 TaxID=3154870 RepID=UPI0034391D68